MNDGLNWQGRVRELTHALGALQARIVELESENADLDSIAMVNAMNFSDWQQAQSERDALAAVIEKVRSWIGTEDDWWDEDDGPVHAPVDLHKILEAVPADLLREHDADVWDAGFADGRRQDAEGDDGPRFANPYRVKPEKYDWRDGAHAAGRQALEQHEKLRVKPEDEWVDPEPWFYPVSGMRTAHKLAQTNAEYRPRTVKPEDER